MMSMLSASSRWRWVNVLIYSPTVPQVGQTFGITVGSAFPEAKGHIPYSATVLRWSGRVMRRRKQDRRGHSRSRLVAYVLHRISLSFTLEIPPCRWVDPKRN